MASPFTRGRGPEHRNLFLPPSDSKARVDRWCCLLGYSRPRRDRVSIRHPLRRFLGASRIHAFAVLRRSSGKHRHHSHVPSRDIWDRAICPFRVFVLGNSKSRRARCDHEWRTRSRILFAVRQHSLFLCHGDLFVFRQSASRGSSPHEVSPFFKVNFCGFGFPQYCSHQWSGCCAGRAEQTWQCQATIIAEVWSPEFSVRPGEVFQCG